MAEIEERRFRRAMAQLPAGVTVATADDGRQAHGVTVSSFTSVSLSPPLCLVCLRLESPLLPILRAAKRFAVHILAADQAALARRFAEASAEARLEALRRAPDAPPTLDGALVRFDFRLSAEHRGGDHAIVIGEALAIENAADNAADPPDALTWWRSRLGALAPTES